MFRECGVSLLPLPVANSNLANGIAESAGKSPAIPRERMSHFGGISKTGVNTPGELR
jgi:hypothetical protein